MINNRLLNEFKSADEKERTVIIKDIKCTIDSCGQEVLSIITDQISIPPSSIEKGYDITQKTLEVEGHLDLDDNKEYYTNLVGFVIDGKVIQGEESIEEEQYILNDKYRSPTSHFIEVIRTPLEKKINIEFSKEYSYQPNIVITVDEDYESLYSSYSISFIKNSLNEKYTGAVITFNNLKNKFSYPEIGITIIGDPKESYFDGLIKTEEKVELHLIKTGYCNTDIHIFEMIEMVKADIKNSTIYIEDENGEKVEYTTDNCGKVSPILKYGTYRIQYNDIVKEITVEKNKTSFEIDFSEEPAEEENENDSP